MNGAPPQLQTHPGNELLLLWHMGSSRESRPARKLHHPFSCKVHVHSEERALSRGEGTQLARLRGIGNDCDVKLEGC